MKAGKRKKEERKMTRSKRSTKKEALLLLCSLSQKQHSPSPQRLREAIPLHEASRP